MLFELTPDQEFFRDNVDRFLREQVPVDQLRRLRNDPAGYGSQYWQKGADLGWTTLLVDEEQGGGSISGAGLVDLTLIAHEFGRHAAPGPLTPTNVVAALLNRYPTDEHNEILQALIEGTSTAAWCFQSPNPKSRVGARPVSIRIEGDVVVVSGTKRPVEAAQTADFLLVTGATEDGHSQVVVPRTTPGVTVTPLRSIDVTRRYAAVEFDEVQVPITSLIGAAGHAEDDIAFASQLAVVISCAESVGALQAAFDLTLEWAFERYSFGRALASYQEIKHRFADMKTWLEASHAIADAAAAAVASGAPDATELTSAAKSYIGEYGGELMQDCIQIHGGIGVTFEHDLHLFVRRATSNRSMFGTPAEHRQSIADIVTRQEATA